VIQTGPTVVYAADGTAMPVWTKDPSDVVDYTLDWSLILNSNDSIEAAEFIVEPASELTVLSVNFTATQATCWLQAGVLGLTYAVTCRVTTADGRQQEYTFQIVCGAN
jgi:hypothetical protein